MPNLLECEIQVFDFKVLGRFYCTYMYTHVGANEAFEWNNFAVGTSLNCSVNVISLLATFFFRFAESLDVFKTWLL